MWHDGNGMGWWMLFGSVWFVVFWGLVIWLVFSLVNRLQQPQTRGGESALEIARARYARSEISREEFEQIRRDLTA